MADTFQNVSNRQNPADNWFLVVPGAGDLAITPRGVLCSAVGDITMQDRAGTVMTLTAVAAGTVLPLRPLKITAATGTFYGLY